MIWCDIGVFSLFAFMKGGILVSVHTSTLLVKVRTNQWPNWVALSLPLSV